MRTKSIPIIPVFIKILLIILTVILVLIVLLLGMKNNIRIKAFQSNRNILLDGIKAGDLEGTSHTWMSLLNENMEQEDLLEELSASLEESLDLFLSNPEESFRLDILLFFSQYTDPDLLMNRISCGYDRYLNQDTDLDAFLFLLERVDMLYNHDDHTSWYRMKARSVHESRKEYQAALELFHSGDYKEAILLFNKIPPDDTIYYPNAQNYIDQAIESLRELMLIKADEIT